jgi:peptide/nickel transport system substrate-binding protein
MHNRRDILAGLVASTAIAGLPAIARSQSAQAARIVIGMPVGPRSLEPTREVSNVIFRTAYNIYDTPIAIDYKNDARLVPGLATSWKRLSPTMVELTLREGVRFHDGSIMTAEDVAFSFGAERMGEKSPGHQLTRPFVGSFERVEAVDPRTVRVVARASDPLIEQRLAGWGSQIVSKKAFLATASTDGKDFGAWERAPVATGPFRVKEFRTDDRIVLEAHDGYFGGRPAVKEAVFRVMPEASARYAALAAGDIDIATEMSVDQIPTIEKHKGLKVLGGPIQNIRVLVYDKTHPVLADVRIRRALSLAIDRRAIVDSLSTWAVPMCRAASRIRLSARSTTPGARCRASIPIARGR